MTAELVGVFFWSHDPIKQRLAGYAIVSPGTRRRDRLEKELMLTEPFEIRLPIRDIAP